MQRHACLGGVLLFIYGVPRPGAHRTTLHAGLPMSPRRARPFRVLLLILAVTAGAVVLWRGAAVGEDVTDVLLPDPAEAATALTDVPAAADSAPPKPRRQIVPEVEVVVNIPSGRL